MKKRIIAIVAVFAMSLCGFALAACTDNVKKYTVTYNANGGYFSDAGTLSYYETVAEGEYAKGENTPKNDDATLEFKGWGANAETKTVIKLSSYPIKSDTEFFAVWEKKTPPVAQCTVTFYYNYEGAAQSTFTTSYVDSGDTVAKPQTDPSRGGAWQFDGWYTQAVGGNKYNFSTAVTGTLELYAHWSEITEEPKIVSIEVYQEPKTEYVQGQQFVDDGLIVRAIYSGGKQPETLTKGVDYTVSQPDMNKLGSQTVTVTYVADGETLTDTFNINIVEKAIASIVIGGDLKLKKQEVGAKFDPTGLTFTVNYNDEDHKDLTAGEMTFASELLDDDGTFKAEGEARISVSYDGFTSKTTIAVTVFTPEETKYNVEFIGNNEAYKSYMTGLPATQRVVENEKANQPTAPKLNGFIFKGWYTEAACQTAYDFDAAVTKNAKLYAKWQAIEYVVDYKLNGGTNVAGNKATYTVNGDGVFETTALLDPAKDHNTFDGWFFDSGYETQATELSYAVAVENAVKDGETYTVSLYAKFTPGTYDIVYEWGDGNEVDYEAGFVDGYNEPLSYTFGKGVELPDATKIKIEVRKAGEAVEFNFLGWYIKGDAGKNHITSIGTTLFDNKTVVADIVQSAAYNVTFDYNYDGSTPTVRRVISGEYAKPLSSDPKRAGYDFDNWYTKAKADDEGCELFAFATTKIEADTVIYAHWTPANYDVVFIGLPKDATNPNAAVYTVESGDNGTVALVDPTNLPLGYRFFGWYADNKYKTEITELTPADIENAESITVYAKCNDLYTVTFVGNASGVNRLPEAIENVSYGDGVARPATDPTRTNYTFDGWYADAECTVLWVFTDDNGTATQVQPTAENDYKCEIFAKWVENADSGVYLIGTVGGEEITMRSADIADYKLTTQNNELMLRDVKFLDGDRFRIIRFVKTNGAINDIADEEYCDAPYPTNAFDIEFDSGFNIVSAANRGINAEELADLRWELHLTLSGEPWLYIYMQREEMGVTTRRDPDGTEVEQQTTGTCDDPSIFIYGTMTGYQVNVLEWSNNAESSKLNFVMTNNAFVVQGVKLYKYDEIGVCSGGGTLSFIDVYKGLGTPIAIAQSNFGNGMSTLFTGETGLYDITLDFTGGIHRPKCTQITIFAHKTLAVSTKADKPIYVGKIPTAENLTVTLDGVEVNDYTIQATAATGENDKLLVVHKASGTFAEIEYTATPDAIKSIEITTAPATLAYYVGSALDFDDIVLTVTYNSGDVVIASADHTDLLNRISFELAEMYYADGTLIKADGKIEVTVKFDGTACDDKIKIDVYNKLTSIVVEAPATTEYVSGVSETLDYDGLKVTAYYNGKTESDDDAIKATVSIKSESNENGYTIDSSAYVFDAVGGYDITIALTETFGALSSSASGKFTVTVVAPKVVAVAAAADSELEKTTQLIGSAFDASGLKFVGTKNDKDNTEVEIAATDMTYEITVEGEVATRADGTLVKSGTATVTATYTVGGEELTAAFDTAVTFEIENKLTSIEATQPTVASFPQNGTFDKSGMTVTAKYNEGIAEAEEATDTIDLENCTVTADLTTVGESAGVVTVKYTENGITVTTTVNVKVTEPKVVEVTVTGIATQRKYYVGETFAPAGLGFRATYDNGTTKNLTAAEFTFNGGNAFDVASATANSTVVSIAYTADGTAVVNGNVTVTVYDRLTSIVVTAQPTMPHGEYGWVVGDEIELDGVQITAYYNGTTVESENAISKIVTDYTTNAKDVNMSTAGKKTITVTYKENLVNELTVTCPIEIDVVAKVMVALEYKGEPIVQYTDRTFDPKDITFVKVYNNGDKEDIVNAVGVTFDDETNEWIDPEGKFVQSGSNANVRASYVESGETFRTYIANVTVSEERVRRVSFNGNSDYDVMLPDDVYATYNTAVDKPTTDPVCYGFTFGGWYKEASCTTAWIFNGEENAMKVLTDTTLYAKWTANKYIINLEENGEAVGDPFNYNASENVFAPKTLPAPTSSMTGYTCKGWTYYDLENPTDEYIFTELTQARLLPEYSSKAGSSYLIVLKPCYEKDKFTVTFDGNGGTDGEPQTVEYQGKATKPETDPTRNYYEFAGWYASKTPAADEAQFDFKNTEIVGATTIYAKWTAKEYAVEYVVDEAKGETDGGNPATYNADQGSVKLNDATTEQDGKVFLEWQDANGDKVTALTTALIKDGKITLTAVFGDADVFTVSFNSDGGTEVDDQSIVDGKTASKPDDPTKLGYKFLGWFLGSAEEAFDFDNTPIKGDIELTAKWQIKNYTVSFDSDGGSSVEPIDVQEGSYVGSAPEAPEKKGYNFIGWFHGSEATAFDFENTVIMGDIELTAKWEKKPVAVTVNYNYAGAPAEFDGTVNNGIVVEPEKPTRDYYRFDGWYTVEKPAAGDKPFDFATAITEDTTLFANWVAVNGLYSGTTLLKEFVVQTANVEYAAKAVGINGSAASPVTMHVVVDGAIQTKAVNVKSGSADGFTSSTTTGLITVKASGIYTIYYRYVGGSNDLGLYISRMGDYDLYEEPQLQDGDGVYVNGEHIADFVVNENNINQVMAQNFEIVTENATDVVEVTLVYNGNPAELKYLEVDTKTGSITATQDGNAVKMYAGTYSFYYNYAKNGTDTGTSHEHAAGRLWVEGKQTGAPATGSYLVIGDEKHAMTDNSESSEYHAVEHMLADVEIESGVALKFTVNNSDIKVIIDSGSTGVNKVSGQQSTVTTTAAGSFSFYLYKVNESDANWTVYVSCKERKAWYAVGAFTGNDVEWDYNADFAVENGVIELALKKGDELKFAGIKTENGKVVLDWTNQLNYSAIEVGKNYAGNNSGNIVIRVDGNYTFKITEDGKIEITADVEEPTDIDLSGYHTLTLQFTDQTITICFAKLSWGNNDMKLYVVSTAGTEFTGGWPGTEMDGSTKTINAKLADVKLIVSFTEWSDTKQTVDLLGTKFTGGTIYGMSDDKWTNGKIDPTITVLG